MAGKLMTATLELAGQRLILLNGGRRLFKIQ
jgi:hypothetical protein